MILQKKTQKKMTRKKMLRKMQIKMLKMIPSQLKRKRKLIQITM